MRSNEIWLTPYGGLANRMRAVNSMVEFTRETAIPLNVVWFANFELNAPFSSLFLPIQDSMVSIEESKPYSRFLYNSPRRNNLWIPYITSRLYFDRIIYYDEFIRLRDNNLLGDTLRSGGRIFVESCYDFGHASEALARNFVPTQRLQEAVCNFVDANFASRTVGVHIRRTDNTLAIEQSPIKLFMDAMQREIQAFPDVKFYVASDDEKEKELLKNRFGGRIITRSSDCRRNCIEGIESAVEDMYILSCTAKIYGSFYSSFSDIAAKLRGAEIEVLSII
ncbi:MAG: hypothetical protein RR293_07555 [Bacteroidales bacterium]